MPGLDWAGTRTAFDRVETRWPQIGRYRNRLDHRLQPLTVRWRHVRRLGPLPNWVPGVLVISLVVLLLAPPQTVFIPTGGLDPSYYAGLAMAKTRGLHFGSEVMFTYGPWGFLENTGVYETGPAWWATLYRVLVQSVAVFALVAVLRHNFGRLATLAIGFVSARWGFELMYGVGPSRLLTVTVIGVLVFVLTRRVTPGRGWALAASVLGSFLVLVKFNDGVVVLTAAALAAVVSGWRRSRVGVAPRPTSPSEADSLLLAGGDSATASSSSGDSASSAKGAASELLGTGVAGLVSLLAFWLLAGQRLGDLPRFVRGSLELSRGFSTAMQTTSAGAMGDVGVALLIGSLTMAVCWSAGRGGGRFTQVGSLAIGASLIYGTWKHGFVRQGADRELFYFLGLSVVMLFAARNRWRSLVALLAIGVMGWSVAHFDYEPRQRLSLANAPVGWGDTVSVLTSGKTRADFRQQGLDYLRASYRLPAEIYDQMDGKSIHVDQWETALAWAFAGVDETTWRPEPVFQRYTAYTPWLDNANAEALTGAAAPSMIVAERNVIDRHLSRFDAPHTVRSMVCNYRLTVPGDPVPVGRDGTSLAETVDDASRFARTPPWVLWTRADNRCGSVDEAEALEVPVGDLVDVPIAPGDDYFVLARFDEMDQRPVDRMQQMLWKGDEWFIRTPFDGPADSPDAQTFRFVTSTATQWHVLSWPACLDMSPEAFDPGSITSFRLAPGTRPSPESWDITLKAHGDPYTVTFATQPYTCD